MIIFEGVDRSLREGVVFKFISSLSELNAVVARRDGVGESQGQGITIVGRSQTALLHVFLALKLYGITAILDAEAVLHGAKAIGQAQFSLEHRLRRAARRGRLAAP